MTLTSRFRSRSSPSLRYGTGCSPVSAAQQQFAQEADVNYIVSRYIKTGYYYDPHTIRALRTPEFLDATLTLEETSTILEDVAHEFDRLPASLRQRFRNDPVLFAQFVSQDDNSLAAINAHLAGLGSQHALIPTDKSETPVPETKTGEANTPRT